jgi:hypothetical protein
MHICVPIKFICWNTYKVVFSSGWMKTWFSQTIQRELDSEEHPRETNNDPFQVQTVIITSKWPASWPEALLVETKSRSAISIHRPESRQFKLNWLTRMSAIIRWCLMSTLIKLSPSPLLNVKQTVNVSTAHIIIIAAVCVTFCCAPHRR